jgi:hypothetical protein
MTHRDGAASPVTLRNNPRAVGNIEFVSCNTAVISCTNNMALDDAKRSIISRHAHRLLSTRAWPKTICPSEIARALSTEELRAMDASEWRDTMDNVRHVVWEKKEAGEVEVMQKGEVVHVESLEDIRGPIRVRNVKR